MDPHRLSGDEAAAAAPSGWLPVLGGLEARFVVPDLGTATRLAADVAGVVGADDRGVAMTISPVAVRVRLATGSPPATTQRDLELAGRVSSAAAGLGVASTTVGVQRLEVALDTADVEASRAFWAAVLGLDAVSRPDEVVDPERVLPALWFQPTDPHEEPRQRFHLDLWVAPDEVDDRIEAALRAGGSLVSDHAAPAFWVLADPDGNKVCLCTHRDRPA